MLAERVAICLWKLRRLEYYQMGIVSRTWEEHLEPLIRAPASGPKITKEVFRSGSKGVTEIAMRGAASGSLIPNDWHMRTIMRYEAHLHRQYIQTLHELKAIQARREGNPTPLVRLGITAPPGT